MTNIFNLDETDQVTLDPNKSYYTDLVGPGQKFKDNEELARGKFHSDTYIPILEKRLDASRQREAQLMEQLNTGPKLQELIDQLKQTPLSKETPQDLNSETKGLDANQVEELIARRMQERDLNAKQQENERLVKSKLKERFGTNTQALNEQMESLGISPEFASDLARNQPQVFLRTFGLDKPQQTETFQSPPRNQRLSGPQPTTQKRTWSYYEDMRVNKPKLYNDPKIAVQMQNDAIALGDEFRDGNYDAF